MKCLLKTMVMSFFVVMSISASSDNLLNDAAFTKDGGQLFWVNQTVIDAGGSGTIVDGKAVAKSPVLDKQEISNIQLIDATVTVSDMTIEEEKQTLILRTVGNHWKPRENLEFQY